MSGKYSEESLRKIDERLGTGHRVEPYDLTSTADLKQALLTTVAAYRDFEHYRCSLSMIDENFDESLEYCDTTAWLDLSNAPDEVDELVAEGVDALGAVINAFERLAKRARDNLVEVIKAILSAPPATQNLIFGCEYKAAQKNTDAHIDKLFEALGEADYHHSMPENLNTFLVVMREQWSSAA